MKPLVLMPTRRVRRKAGALVLAGVCMLAPLAQAQEAPVQVLSGEHEDFTRIAMVFAPPVAWSFDRVVGGYVLRLDGAAPELDISGVFTRIPRTRLQAMDVKDDGGLHFEVSSGTQARAYEDRPGLLIIDMRSDAPAPRRSPRQRAQLQPPPPMDWLDWGLAGMSGPSTLDTPVADQAGGTGPQPPTVDDPDGRRADPGQALDMGAARAALLRELDRAAQQGLITPVTPSDDVAPRMPPAAAPPPQQRLSGIAGDDVLHSETGVDRAARLARGGAADGDGCLPGAQDLDVVSWGGDGPAARQLAQARHAVYGAATPGPADLRDLVRLYLHFGFGAEARVALDMFADDTAGNPDPKGVLRTLSAIVDGDSPPPGSALAGMVHCDGPVVMWALLADGQAPEAEGVPVADATRAFSRLPPALRRNLGPRLAQRLLELDEIAAARAVHDALARITDASDPALLTVAARLDRAAGDAAAARAGLRPLVASNAPGSDDAVVMLIDAELARDRAPPAELVASAGARASARAGTPIGMRLARAEALGLAALGDFDAAFAAQRRATSGAMARDGEIPLGAALIGRLAKDAPDSDFLRLIFARADWQDGALPLAIRTTLANRFLNLGLGRAASLALGQAPASAPEEELLRAQIRIMRGDADGALHLLEGLSQAKAARLRSRAYARLGDYRGALETLLTGRGVDMIAPQELGYLAWRAGDWEIVRSHGTQAQRALLDFAPPAPNDLPDGSGPLAMGHALVTAGPDLRARVSALIDATALP